MGSFASEGYGDQGWSLRFQKKIVALAFRDPAFLNTHREVLDASYFEYDNLIRLMDLIIDHYDKYGQPPSHIDQLVLDYCDRYSLGEDVQADLCKVSLDLLRMDTSDIEWVSDKVVEFGRVQTFRQALGEVVDLVQEGDTDRLDEAREIIEKALSVGRGGKNNGIDLGDIMWRLPELNMQNNNFWKVPTGLPLIDKCLSGGLGAGEVGIWVAPPAVGKSMILQNLAANALLNKKSVAFFTFELSELDVANRIMSRTLLADIGTLQSPTRESMEEYNESLEQVVENSTIDLENYPCKIRYYSPGTVDVGKLRSYLTYLRARHGFSPQIIIIDYADKLRPSRRPGQKFSSDDLYSKMGNVMEEMKALGDAFKCPVWTASQFNREGVKKCRTGADLGDLQDIAESMRKGHDADVVITVNQTLQEYDDCKARAFIAKDRRGRQGVIIDLDMDYSVMRVSESRHQVSHDDYFGSREEGPKVVNFSGR